MIDPADNATRVKVTELVPYAKNARTHSDEQIAKIMASIREWGFTTPILRDETGLVIAGHGRLLAAMRLGLEDVPVVTAVDWTDGQKRAYTIADNQLALQAGWDDELLEIELGDLETEGFDLELIGFDDDELSEHMEGDTTGNGNGSDEEGYTTEIKIPIYETKNEKPSISELIDNKKTVSLIEEIEQSNLPDNEKLFLKYAAERHTIFNFSKIADYYAHSGTKTQSLMERSALVIIDYNKAIENGFVSMTNELGTLVDNEK